MSTSVAAAGIAVYAAAEANAARTELCKITIASFNAQQASVPQMQAYASCIERLYPEALSADATIILKALLILAIAGFIGGTAFSRLREEWQGWPEHLFVGGMFSLSAPLIAIGIFALGKCFQFLFS